MPSSTLHICLDPEKGTIYRCLECGEYFLGPDGAAFCPVCWDSDAIEQVDRELKSFRELDECREALLISFLTSDRTTRL